MEQRSSNRSTPVIDNFTQEDYDFIDQLQSKIRQQKSKLSSLDQCRQIQQEIFQEQDLNHPCLSDRSTPVRLSEQATIKRSKAEGNSTKLQENFRALQKKYRELVSYKLNLEQSLRNETLANEEQRSYIQILKQVIEQRMDSLGIPAKKFNDFTEFALFKQDTQRVNSENKELATALKNQEETVIELQNKVKELQSNVEALKNENNEQKQDLAQAADALQQAEEEINRVEEEKSSLLSYVDENEQSLDKVRADKDELQQKFNTLLQNYNDQISIMKDYEQSILNKDRLIKEEYEKNLMLTDVTTALRQSEERNKQLQGNIDELKSELIEKNERIDGQFSNINTLSSTLKETQEIKDKIEADLASAYQKYDGIYEQLQSFQQQLHKETVERANLHSNLVNVTAKNDHLLSEKMQLQSDYEKLESDKKFQQQFYHDKIAKLKDKVVSLRNQQQSLLKENQLKCEEISQFTNEVDNLKRRNNLLMDDIIAYQQKDAIMKQMGIENKELQKQIDQQLDQIKDLQNSIHYYQNLSLQQEGQIKEFSQIDYSGQVRDLEFQLDQAIQVFNQLGEEILEFIQQFISMKQYHGIISKKCFNLMQNWKYCSQYTSADIRKWIEITINELGLICDRIYQSELELQDQQQVYYQKLQELKSAKIAQEDAEQLKYQIQQLHQENKQLLNQQTGQNLQPIIEKQQQEIIKLRNELNTSNEKNLQLQQDLKIIEEKAQCPDTSLLENNLELLQTHLYQLSKIIDKSISLQEDEGIKQNLQQLSTLRQTIQRQEIQRLQFEQDAKESEDQIRLQMQNQDAKMLQHWRDQLENQRILLADCESQIINNYQRLRWIEDEIRTQDMLQHKRLVRNDSRESLKSNLKSRPEMRVQFEKEEDDSIVI